MNWCRYLVILVVVPAFALPAPAGLFDRRPKPDPAKRVPELLGIVKTEKSDSKRSAAAEELRQYDPKAFPEIIPVLIDVSQNDASSSVRLDALHTLSKFRPVSPAVGEALENAVAHDKSLRVRLQARTTLISYHMSGYHGAQPTAMPPQALPSLKTTEPPLAATPAISVAPPVITVETPSAPLASPVQIAPMVSGTAQLMPAETPSATPGSPRPQPPAAAMEGPDLAPPPW
jgi:HEAT repeats